MREKRHGFLLCDDVGMGKTCSALTVIVEDIHVEGDVRQTLVLCPGGIEKSTWHVGLVLVAR